MTPDQLWKILEQENLSFFTGVPDSTFKGFMSFLDDNDGNGLKNVIASNECEAVAIAAGHHLATGNVGVVYMQNAGEGKTVNPITSLADKEVYSIPMVLMIGWRGEPGKKDEPQHVKMGRVMLPILDDLEIPYAMLPEDPAEAQKIIKNIHEKAKETSAPVALIIKKGLIEKYPVSKSDDRPHEMTREHAVKTTLGTLGDTDAIVSTTGKTSRELFETRASLGDSQRDFLTVGSMGCSASIGLGVAMQKPERQIYIFDGDGAVIMQMGALATIGHYRPKNLRHIVFDNQAYDSTGGQPTVANTLDLEKVSIGCGYTAATTVETEQELISAIRSMRSQDGPTMIIVKVNKGARKDLGRPTSTPVENKKRFMEFLK